MKVVGLYLDNLKCKFIDLENPESGNPGIGGTQFNFISLPYYYQKNSKGYKFILYCRKDCNLPSSVEKKVISSIEELVQDVSSSCDLFIFRPTECAEGIRLLSLIEFHKVNSIAWAHNTPFNILGKLASSSSVVKYVNVSHEQYDMLRDHSIFEKSTFIYNGFDLTSYTGRIDSKEKRVVYLGSLVKAKGFHVLASVWKEILALVPDAKLDVIGSGQLYDCKVKMGVWGIAEESYEQEFRSALTDPSTDKLLPSVTFHGSLGKSKIPILKKAMVGVPNPTGVTENCPGSAIEFSASGTAIVTGNDWGLLDTVINNRTGLLSESPDNLRDNIVYLLRNDQARQALELNGPSFVSERFNYETISKQWESLFLRALNKVDEPLLSFSDHPYYEYKQLSERMRKLKKKYKLLRFIPSYIEVRPYHRKIKKVFS